MFSKKNISKLGKAVVILSFFTLISLPSIGMFFPEFTESFLNEKRERASLPPLEINQDFFEKFNNYFADNFGFRDFLIHTNAKIDKSVFQSANSDQVFIGREGWMFYQESLNSRVLSQVDLESVANRILDLQNYLREREKDFLFMVAPDKESIKRELLPWFVDRNEENYQGLMALLEKKNVNYVDLKKALFAHRKKDIYSKLETHWTHLGVVIAANRILQFLDVPELQYEIIPGQRDGDLSDMIGIPAKEDVPRIKIVEPEKKEDKNLLVFHDSFGIAFKDYFDPIFSGSKFVHWKDKESFYESLEKHLDESVDMVILEFVERDIPHVLEFGHVKGILNQ